MTWLILTELQQSPLGAAYYIVFICNWQPGPGVEHPNQASIVFELFGHGHFLLAKWTILNQATEFPCTNINYGKYPAVKCLYYFA